MDIRQLRQQKGWSQEQLADITGLSSRTIQRIENGEPASNETMRALAAVFDIPLSEIRPQSASDTQAFTKPLFSHDEQVVLREIRKLRGFYIHATVYVAVNVMLIFINLVTYHKVLWSFGSLFGWGLGLFFHGLMVYKPYRRFGANWERREFEKRMRQHQSDFDKQ